ncbi:MAG: 16S rRNA (guanine(966)-N(2))-methyltransferase RsmD [Moraxellaceae bacterium]|nr:16S rRNA (guanine(966)-N(2))-methyltransferase RsmD [Moraxellaceae bacterium]MDP1775179.1 16S rRNA (guanine(966)-N(2))-methyltransferase RsmD [Moraxellaceae bacterium]MDZ4297223.1 16S rRNA (guanine(966)-N(2))-methyltransferase RsmD [Moraxellaceae bacterium]MDZ4386203.1 16S rRNA (guanine(966)-N(2))-methyltransferase RsmD [Moraxellaceae bacterium]
MTKVAKGGQRELRIIAGRWRSRRVRFLDVPGLRPTPDRVRETLYNWLQFEITRCHVLDLFAGSGALAFEAASRGAEQVTLIEKDAQQAQCLRQNLALLEAESCQLICADSLQWLKQAPTKAYDLVLLDPPFNLGLVKQVIDRLMQQAWLKPSAWVYIETELSPEALELPAQFALHRQTRAGLVHALLYRVTQS